MVYPRGTAATWVRQGRAERLGRGLYRLVDTDTTELDTLACVAAAVPRGVFCLLTALRFHEIGTESPPDVWIAVPRGSRLPKTDACRVRVRFFRFSAAMMRYGVEERVAQGVPFRVTSPARTVVDCFRLRNKIGLPVALEALDDVLRDRKATVREIVRAAEIGRVANLIRPYLAARSW